MEKYKITIEKITEYDETIIRWRDPQAPDQIEESKYNFDESVRDRLVSHIHSTGKKLRQSEQIYEQIVEDLEIDDVIKAVNNIG